MQLEIAWASISTVDAISRRAADHSGLWLVPFRLWSCLTNLNLQPRASPREAKIRVAEMYPFVSTLYIIYIVAYCLNCRIQTPGTRVLDLGDFQAFLFSASGSHKLNQTLHLKLLEPIS